MLLRKIAEWQARPDKFVREAIGAEPDPWQVEAMLALVNKKRVSIASCHGPGKDAMAAWLILWCMVCFKNPKIPCTAPTGHQLYDLLWAEVAKWHDKMIKGLRETIIRKKDRIENIKHPETWYAVARTAKPENSEALQGFHADVILVIIDEASGVTDPIFEVLEGATGNKNTMMLVVGNPTQPSGFFFDSHHSDRARWHAMTVDYTRSWRVPRDWVAAMKARYGEDSNFYRVRVLGQFPKSADDVVIPLEWVEKAAMRDLYKNEQGAISIGVDVARKGEDDSAIVVREGRNILTGGIKHGQDTIQVTGWVVLTAKKLHKKLKGPDDRIYIFVDGIGVGAGVVDLLRQVVSEKNYPWIVVEVNVAERSSRMEPECMRKRDELWWKAREFFRLCSPAFADTTMDKDGVTGFDRDIREQLIAELSSPRFDTPLGKVKVESKDEMKARQVASPNLADAFMHTMAFEATKPEEKKKDSWRDEIQQVSDDWMVS